MNSLSGKLVLMHLVAKRNGDLKKHFQKWNALFHLNYYSMNAVIL